MDGLETVRRIRAVAGEKIAVIMVTAGDASELEQKAKRLGVQDILTKPLFQSSMAAALENLRQGGPRGAQGRAPLTERDFCGKHILLVEDNQINLEIAKELIGATGAVIDTAQDGTQAVEAFAASAPGHYDLILMDIQMPQMDGYEATRRIRAMARPDARSVPIFAMTANAFAEDEEKSRQAGMDAHISKPLDIKALFVQMARFLPEPGVGAAAE